MDTFGPEDADAWYERNKHKLGVGVDPVMHSIEWAEIKPSRVLEFGCANGWRLAQFHKNGCDVLGVEISKKARQDAVFPVEIRSTMPIRLKRDEISGPRYDLVIHGFDLYVASPHWLFHAALFTDFLVEDGGHLIIHDFLPEHPYSRIFEHNTELRSRKMDHAKLWLAHPAYSMVRRDIYGDGDDRTHVTILKKDMANAFPLED